jgi:hypothetical protein
MTISEPEASLLWSSCLAALRGRESDWEEWVDEALRFGGCSLREARLVMAILGRCTRWWWGSRWRYMSVAGV